MPRTCTVCGHAERAAIDSALAAGISYRVIARQYSVSHDAVQRHAKEHVAQAVAASQAAKSDRAALDVVAQLRAVNGATLDILKEARAKRDPDLALKAIDRLQRQIELQAKLLGDLSDGTQVTVSLAISAEWQGVRAIILSALAPFPEARSAVVLALASGPSAGAVAGAVAGPVGRERAS